MNEEIDEYQVYHQDFTTVSEWEVFIARIEEMLMEWRLSNSQIDKYPNYKKKWTKSSEEFDFQGLTFTLSYHTIEYESSKNKSEIDDKKTLLSELQDGIWEAANNFIDDVDGSPFAVSNWFGLKRYLMLCCNKPLTDGSLIKTVLSSVNIASANVQCAVPLFVKIREEWQQCYLGFFEDNQFKTSFDTIHLKRISHQCSYLKNLVGLFKSKIASPVAIDEILGSAKFSYELKELDAFMWNNSLQTNEFLSIECIDVEKLIELPFGSTDNPVQSAMLNAIWPTFRENTITDRESWSQLNPLRAPIWTITLQMAEKNEYLLFSIIAKMMSILQDTSFLMDSLGLSRSLGIHNPLHKITEAPITISKLVKAAISQSTNKSVFKGPLGDDMLMPILYYLFPDAVEDSTFGYPTSLEVELKQTNTNEQKLCSYVKTGPVDGLVWRLSLIAARLLDEGGLPYLAHLWYEFVQELQYRWENHILVPGIADGTPDARTCLLHQKLQLLNCCITRAKVGGGGGAGAGAGANSSEEEFYDCTESDGEEHAPWDRPAGRLRRLGDATLQSGAPLYVPVTQDPAPKTEDELEEDAELMVRLGNDAKASELRARMMSASLLSDMESFKAANPGATLCDFVQWYSPRDWKPDGGGTLSERMLLPDNPWAQAWSVARPVPAARQRRLFDEARVAARLLHYLRSRTAAGVAELLLPALLRAAAERAHRAGAPRNSTATGGIDTLRTCEIAAHELLDAERAYCRHAGARLFLGDGEEGQPLSGEQRARVAKAVGDTWAGAARREYTVRVRQAGAAQVLRAALAADMLLVGAFTEPVVCL